MSIKIVFNVDVLIHGCTNTLNEENYEFYKMVKACSETGLIQIKESKQEFLPCFHKLGHDIMIFKDDSKIEEYLYQQSKSLEFILYFYDGLYKEDGNVIYMPIDFYGDLKQFENRSFTEHAKNKLLYNELSKYYMESIANDTAKEVQFLDMIFHRYKQGRTESILDCCCGVGRHDYQLAEKGYSVTGIDISQSQINNAKKIHFHDKIHYEVSDIRFFNLPFKSYDMAICMWTTYNYLSLSLDLTKFLKNVYDHLSNDGILVLDSKNIPSLELRRVYNRSRSKDEIKLNLFVCKRIIDNIQNSQYFYFINDHGKKIFYFDEEFVRFYYLDELAKLTKNYFDILACYGGFDGEAYKEEESERFIIVLKKRRSQ